VKEGIGAYLESHPDDTTADGERYRRQHGIASELVDELEEAARPQRIIELLAALKECGKFPRACILKTCFRKRRDKFIGRAGRPRRSSHPTCVRKCSLRIALEALARILSE